MFKEIKNPSIILSLFSRVTHETKSPSPKNYPYYLELVNLLKQQNIQTIQIGVKDETNINADLRFDNLPIPKLIELSSKVSLNISIDNFYSHFCHFYKRKCIVLYSLSNPSIWGYPENINLLKDKKYLRPIKQQYEFWENIKPIKESFVEPQEVLKVVLQEIGKNCN